MSATATITAIRTTHRREFIPHEMPVAGATMTAPAKNAYLVNKITFLQDYVFTLGTIVANIPYQFSNLSK